MRLLPCHKSGNHRTAQETKGLHRLPFKFFCRFRGGVPPAPYVHPISPKVTQGHPRLRASAEGRNSKMRKPGVIAGSNHSCGTAVRLCVLKSNQSWTAAALGCACMDLAKDRCPPITHYRNAARSFSFLHLTNSYKQNTNLLYHHFSFVE